MKKREREREKKKKKKKKKRRKSAKIDFTLSVPQLILNQDSENPTSISVLKNSVVSWRLLDTVL